MHHFIFRLDDSVRLPNRPCRVYLASGSSQRLIVRSWIDRLAAQGIAVYDWTRDPSWDLGRPPTENELIRSAQNDEREIANCDLFWYMVPQEKSEGAASELMLARQLGKRIVASGELGARNIFALFVPPSARFALHDDAFFAICTMAAKFRSTPT